jgi:hypothetical protein
MSAQNQRPLSAGYVANTDEMRCFAMMPSFDARCGDLVEMSADITRRHGDVAPYILELGFTFAHKDLRTLSSLEDFVKKVMSPVEPDGRKLTISGFVPTISEDRMKALRDKQVQFLTFISWYDSFDAEAAAASRRGENDLPFGQSPQFFQDISPAFKDILKVGRGLEDTFRVLHEGEDEPGVMNVMVFIGVLQRTKKEMQAAYDPDEIQANLKSGVTVKIDESSYELSF